MAPDSRNGDAGGRIVWTKAETLRHFLRLTSGDGADPAFANRCLLEALRCGFYREWELRQPVLRQPCPEVSKLTNERSRQKA